MLDASVCGGYAYLLNSQLPFWKHHEDEDLFILLTRPQPEGSFWHMVSIQ